MLSYLALVLLPVFVLGIYSYRVSAGNLLRQTRNTMESNVASIVYNLGSNIQRENDNIKYLSYNSAFREKLTSGNASVLAAELNATVEPTFWYFLTSDQNLKGIKIYSPYVEHPIGSFLEPLDAFPGNAWYEENKNDFKTHWFYEDDGIYAVRILLDANTSSKPIGMIKVDVFRDNFISSIYQSEFLNNGVALLDERGNIIGNRRVENQELEEEMQRLIKSRELSGFQETEEYLAEASEELSNGWRVYYYVDKKEISGQMNQILVATVRVMCLCLLAAACLINLISGILSRRVLRLKGYAEQVSHGNFDLEIREDFTDEIGVVEKSFGQMCRKITKMMEDMYRLGMEKRAEELKALQAMINPHFLYNCLSSIKWKAIRAEQDEIADVAGLIARFYRTVLNGGKQITTVKNELDNIKAYLEIQRRMHDGGFDVEYTIEENGLEREMPNFLLQPIVENAICHGIEYCEEGVRGLVRVEYACEGGFLLFQIYNNGPPTEDEEIRKILATPGKGYGLYNIQERIRMYYGEGCGISGHLADNGLVCFTVRLKDHIEASEKQGSGRE